LLQRYLDGVAIQIAVLLQRDQVAAAVARTPYAGGRGVEDVRGVTGGVADEHLVTQRLDD
jgi:hypothetical protein